MKRRLRRAAALTALTALTALATLAALIATSAGCGGPFLVFPGGSLRGEVVSEPPADWSFVDSSFMDLEVRPDDPYSVTLNYFVRDGQLYIDPAEGREWFTYLQQDERVRVRFGFDDRVYLLRAVRVAGPGELEGFDADRHVYRLDPR
jgi:hypothetical protein